MSVFLDKKFESMDWVSQATELYDINLNIVLIEAPIEIDVTFDDVHLGHQQDNLSIDLKSVINRIINRYDNNLSWDDTYYLRTCYTADVHPNTEISYVDKTISPPIKLIKTVFQADEIYAKSVVTKAYLNMIHAWKDCNPHSNSPRMEYLKELANLFLSKESLASNFLKSGRANNESIYFVYEHISKDYLEPSNRIRSQAAAEEFAMLVADYACSGKEETLGKIFRIKIMIDNGQAIYTCGR